MGKFITGALASLALVLPVLALTIQPARAGQACTHATLTEDGLHMQP